MQEVWKPVVGYEGLYEVSNLGRVKSFVRSKDGSILNMSLNSTGYPRVCLRGKFFNIHVLMAMTFLGHSSKKGFVVDHIDHDKSNNNINNLRVISHRENISRIGRGKSQYVGVCFDTYYGSWKAAIQVNGKIKNLGRFKSEIEAHFAYQERLKEIENGK